MTEVPKAFLCPISYDIMKDPVLCWKTGYTFERSEIEKAVSRNPQCPITRKPITMADFAPNRALKDQIDEWLTVHPGASARITGVFAGLSTSAKATTATTKSAAPIPKALTLSAHLCEQARPGDTQTLVQITIEEAYVHPIRRATFVPAQQKERCSIVVVIDRSGSMNEPATEVREGCEADGLSRLDLVKHSVLTLMEGLDDKDFMSVVVFNGKAEVLINMLEMNSLGKEQIRSTIAEIRAGGNTNIYEGARVATELTRSKEMAESGATNIAIILLTDGEPTAITAADTLALWQNYVTTGPTSTQSTQSLHMIGYGYSLDSALLDEMAKIGNGTYGYIPDGSMVATTFVNLVSYIATSYVHAATLYVFRTTNDVYDTRRTIHAVSTGRICREQPRTFILPVGTEELKAGTISVELHYDGKPCAPIVVRQQTPEIRRTGALNLADFARICLADAIVTSVDQSYVGATAVLETMETDIRRYHEALCTTGTTGTMHPGDVKNKASRAFVADLMLDMRSDHDLEGQILKAASSKEWFAQWGRHYLRAVACGHRLQFCNNFKDRAIQHYGGPGARKLKEKLRLAFCALPPPTPSLAAEVEMSQALMSTYVDATGGCFDGEGRVVMGDGTTKKVCDLVAGDCVSTKFGDTTIACTVESLVADGTTYMVNINGTWLTPWHPVLIEHGDISEWYFPCELGHCQSMIVPRVYNVVLNRHHILTINGVQCVTLGHAYEDDIVKHEYFGTDRVIDDLRQINGWDEGRIVLPVGAFQRDPGTGQVTSVRQV